MHCGACCLQFSDRHCPGLLLLFGDGAVWHHAVSCNVNIFHRHLTVSLSLQMVGRQQPSCCNGQPEQDKGKLLMHERILTLQPVVNPICDAIGQLGEESCVCQHPIYKVLTPQVIDLLASCAEVTAKKNAQGEC